MSCELATSRYSAGPLIMGSGLVPVRITLGHPRWKLPYTIDATIKMLAPTRETFQAPDWVARYRHQLDVVGVDSIRRQLDAVSTINFGRGLCLLCFEDLADTKKYPGLEPDHICHRRTFAAWWLEQTGETIRELAGGPIGVLGPTGGQTSFDLWGS